MDFVKFLLKLTVKRPFITSVLMLFLLFTFTRCEVFYAFAEAMTTDDCERYSIYRTRIFGNDELLWEETTCDYGETGIEERFNDKMKYYESIYPSGGVYSEHVTYSQYE